MTADDDATIHPGELFLILEETRRIGSDRRPGLTRRLLALAFNHLCADTGLIQLNRQEMADALGVGVQEISHALTSLELLGAIRRERRSTPGFGGGGEVLAHINPHLAWSGSRESRARWRAQSIPPSLIRRRISDRAD